MTGKEAATILRGAAMILNHMGWCQGANALNAEGRRVPASSKDAVRFCAAGAIVRAHHALGVSIDEPPALLRGWVAKRLIMPVHLFNDHPDRTKEEVIHMLEDLAFAAEVEEVIR